MGTNECLEVDVVYTAEDLSSNLLTLTTTLAKTSTTTQKLVDRVSSLERLVAVLYAAK